MTQSTPAPLVKVLRGDFLESLHRGHLVSVRPDASIEFSLGDPEFPTFLRSAAKPFQALPVIEDGAADAFKLTDDELAIMCGSVSGQNFHVAAVRSILSKIGLTEKVLECGVHPPSHRASAKYLTERGESPKPVHNNCAGKHCAMLALCMHHGYPVEGYSKADHPVQQLIYGYVSECLGLASDVMDVGIDGCGVPVFRAPLKNIALGYVGLATPDDCKHLSPDKVSAIKRMMATALKHPEMIAGDERICTDAMRAAPGRLLAKTGAEASYGLSLVEERLGVAFKIEDGSMRAISPLVVEILAKYNVLDVKGLNDLADYRIGTVKNHRKEIVGTIEAVGL